MSETESNRLNLRSRVHKDKNGKVTKISVERAESPQFPTPAFDEILKNPIPRWLWKKIE